MKKQLSRQARATQVDWTYDILAKGLQNAVQYNRGVGFFSSSIFDVHRDSFRDFFSRGGTMRVVCSNIFSENDISNFTIAICRPQETKPEELAILQTDATAGLITQNLIARRQLRIRVANVNDLAQGRRAIYHEKIGILMGPNLTIAFSGSANESKTAWKYNFERIDVFSADFDSPDNPRASEIIQNFQDLWQNATPRLEIVDLADALQTGNVEVRTSSKQNPPSGYTDETQGSRKTPRDRPRDTMRAPENQELRAYQRDAIDAWRAAGHRGLIEMATGTGKTFTALCAAEEVYREASRGLAICVVAPTIHLVEQWKEQLRHFGANPIFCAISESSWKGTLTNAVSSLNLGTSPLLSIVVTNSTLHSDTFQAAIRRIRKPFLFIGDEAHNLGGVRSLDSLPANANYRLALSATPNTPASDAFESEQANDSAELYFGPTVFAYRISNAIHDGYLSRYDYYIHPVYLTEEEQAEYDELSGKIAKLWVMNRKSPNQQSSDNLRALLQARARIIGSAKNKSSVLKRLLTSRSTITGALVYCGDGRIESEAHSTARQVDEITRMIGVDLGIRCRKYTADTSPADRRKATEDLRDGVVQILVAIRCLDEGVDIPSAKIAFLLASSSNPRQYVQRRGRILRLSPEKRRAVVHDLVVLPNLGLAKANPGAQDNVRRLISSEFKRVIEFSKDAENGITAELDFRALAQIFGVDTLDL
jgi:superfamily II DNA or RNA helicase